MITPVYIPKPTLGRRFAVGDIHGCQKTFQLLVEEQIQLQKQDQLFLLGDYIDRGPNSSGVIDYILALQKEGYQVYTLMGNHEEILLDNFEEKRPRIFIRWVKFNKSLDLIDEEGQIKSQYLDFIKQLTICIELDHFYLVHAGFNFENDSIWEDGRAMLWWRNYEIDTNKLEGKRIVHGHTPKSIQEIRDRIERKDVEIILDNGCVYKHRKRRDYEDGELGRLCALNLDTFELFEQDYSE